MDDMLGPNGQISPNKIFGINKKNIADLRHPKHGGVEIRAKQARWMKQFCRNAAMAFK